MDNDLKLWHGHRRLPQQLTQSDIEDLALALTAYYKGYARAETASPRGRDYVVITTEGWSLAIGSEVWVKILPSIKDGSFVNSVVPLGKGQDDAVYRGGVSSKDQDPLYRRILLSLNTVLK